MKLKQLKYWIHSHPNNEPHCFVVAYAGGAQYVVEIKVKHQLEPLKDDKKGEVMHFDSVKLASDKLKKAGVKKATLRLLDPYDEFGPFGFSCDEDMEMTL